LAALVTQPVEALDKIMVWLVLALTVTLVVISAGYFMVRRKTLLPREGLTATRSFSKTGTANLSDPVARVSDTAEVSNDTEKAIRDKIRTATAKLEKRIEVAEASEERYRDFFEKATDIVFTVDLSGRFLEGNNTIFRVAGYTQEEGLDLNWEKLVAPHEWRKAKQIYLRHAKGEKEMNFELDIVTKTGEIRTVDIGSRPMYDDDRLIGFHGTARDITERKRMQAALIQTRKAADAANQAKTAFLANISHEIRTPLNGILGFLTLLSKTDLSPVQAEYIPPMQQSLRNLLKIINDILDLSRVETGAFSISSDNIDVKSVISSEVALLRPLADEKELYLRLNLDSAIPEDTLGDPTRIAEIITNLVGNAIKFTEKGGVQVSVKLREQRNNSVIIELQVHDTGMGIPGDQIDRLFKPFEQMEARPSRKHTGTGLGLTITRNLVTAMAGKIDVKSQVGKFTRFTVRLPLKLPPDSEESANLLVAELEERLFDADDLSMLIVDDNEINRRFLNMLLLQMGAKIDEAASGEEAVVAATNKRYDVILMDIHMADMDGIEAAQKIRNDNVKSRKAYIIAVTADVVSDSISGYSDAGMDAFLSKPVAEQDMIKVLGTRYPKRVSIRTPVETTDGETYEVDIKLPVDVIDVTEAARLSSGSMEIWLQSLETFMSQLPKSLKEIDASMKNNDHMALKRTCHKLCGGARYIAATRVSELTNEIQRVCDIPESADIPKLVDDLKQAITLLEKTLADHGVLETAEA
jgi:two-component system sensor histidine kinase BarA